MYQNSVIEKENKQRGRNTKQRFFVPPVILYWKSVHPFIKQIFFFFKTRYPTDLIFNLKIKVKLATIRFRILIDSR